MISLSKLVIVESPAKAKTIKKYLGAGYDVIASMGHVRDLPKSRLGVDVKHDFKPKYEIIKGKEDLVDKLKKAAEKSDFVYLATDPDREGEAISWHLAYILGLDLNDKNRVTFNEITKGTVQSGIQNPSSIDMKLVNAQQCRRLLDRIVGYRLSPFVSQKIRRGLSAGRVQSVAVRVICDREEEIRAFVPEEYWTIEGKFIPKGSRKAFPAQFYGTAEDGKMQIANKEQADGILAELEQAEFVVSKLKKGTRRKTPAPPFITSTLQQEASRKLNFQSRRTMKVAQELYEGVEIEGMGAVGIITYMRTDSLRISEDARAEGTEYIRNRWGEKYLPSKPYNFKTKAGAQDGHEAIRPTMPSLDPDSIKDSLTSDQYKLYKLIWSRFTASLMAQCVHDTISVDITAGKYLFKASGYTVKFDGYTVLYEESKDEDDENSGALPPLEEGMPLKVKEIGEQQHFTQPPARYTEATLIKALEENGIGRPSTYATIITTVVGREYVVRDGKALRPTELGELVNKLLKERFSKFVNLKFTAGMEKNLDSIADGSKEWIDTLGEFYGDFEQNLSDVKKAMEGIDMKIPDEETDIVCEKCGRKMVIKTGRYGKFIACPGFPECRNIKKIVHEIDAECPKCGAKVVQKKSKRGKVFYGCGRYPECDFVSWDEPTREKCPQCGKILYKKQTKKINKLYCADKECGYSRNIETTEEGAE